MKLADHPVTHRDRLAEEFSKSIPVIRNQLHILIEAEAKCGGSAVDLKILDAKLDSLRSMLKQLVSASSMAKLKEERGDAVVHAEELFKRRKK